MKKKRDKKYKPVSFSLELPIDDLDVVRRVSELDDRSIGSQVRIIIAEWIENNEKAKRAKLDIAAELEARSKIDDEE